MRRAGTCCSTTSRRWSTRSTPRASWAKGLALDFKRAFPSNFHAYAQACADGRVQPGRIFVTALDDDRWILNFPTKRHWRQPSRIEDITSGLDALVQTLSELDVTSVALPPLGCGHGGLDWDDVRPLVIGYLGDLDVEIRLYGPGDPATEGMPAGPTGPASHPHLRA